jgi:fatty acid desaturase
MLLWWAVFLATLSLALTPHAALVFLALWIAARATVFHLITTFREISDHVGLVPGTLIGFSRNQVSHGLLTQFFHPHNNGYHLVHHLFPGLPYYTWPQVHQLLLGWPDYAAATHCTHYFGGADSLTQSWTHPAASAAPRGQFWHVA